MDTIRIAATKLEGLRPLGGPGDRNHASLRDVIASRFGEDYALLLAEPVPKQDGTRIDWYVPGSRRAVPIHTLTEPERAEVEARLATMRDDILAHADAVERGGGGGTALAKALRAAMVVPGSDSIYAVPREDGSYRPVLVAWAYAPDGEIPRYAGDVVARTPTPAASAASAAPGVALAKAEPMADPQPAVAPTAVAVVQRETPWAWLLWLVLALLVAAILWLLLRSCGFGPAPLSFLDFCRPVVQASAAEDAETGRLVDLVRNLERQVAAQEADCRLRTAALPPPTPPVVEAPEAPAEPTVDDEIRDRARREGGQEGELEITLAWTGRPDLDLRVECPGGGAIAFDSRTCPGAVLDVDMNAGSRSSLEPVEHVSWPQAQPPTGTFRIVVTHFSPQGDTRSQVPFRVVVTDGGRTAMSVEGSVARGSREILTYNR